GDAAGVLELVALGFAGLGVGGALVGQRDLKSLVQEGEFAKALRQGVEVVLGGGENVFIGQEVDLGAALLGVARLLELRSRSAFGVSLLPDVIVAPDLEVELMRERVDDADADAV